MTPKQTRHDVNRGASGAVSERVPSVNQTGEVGLFGSIVLVVLAVVWELYLWGILR